MEGSPHMNQLLQQEVAEKQDPTFKININENHKVSPIFPCFPSQFGLPASTKAVMSQEEWVTGRLCDDRPSSVMT